MPVFKSIKNRSDVSKDNKNSEFKYPKAGDLEGLQTLLLRGITTGCEKKNFPVGRLSHHPAAEFLHFPLKYLVRAGLLAKGDCPRCSLAVPKEVPPSIG